MSNLFTPARYVKIELVGLDGNAFVIVGAWMQAARRQGWSQEDIEKVKAEAISGNYDHLVYTITCHSE